MKAIYLQWYASVSMQIDVVSKFYDMEHGKYTESFEYRNYKYCEPIIGPLPSKHMKNTIKG